MKKRLIWGFLRKSDGHLCEIAAEHGVVCDMVEKMIKNKLWVLNSVVIEKSK